MIDKAMIVAPSSLVKVTTSLRVIVIIMTVGIAMKNIHNE